MRSAGIGMDNSRLLIYEIGDHGSWAEKRRSTLRRVRFEHRTTRGAMRTRSRPSRGNRVRSVDAESGRARQDRDRVRTNTRSNRLGPQDADSTSVWAWAGVTGNE